MISAISQLSNYTTGLSTTAMKSRREEMFSEMDTDGNGSIDKAEFTAFGQQLNKKVNEAKDPEEIFAEIDSDGDGNITKIEMDAFDAKMAEKMKAPPEDMFTAMDTDGNSSVDKTEFAAFGPPTGKKSEDSENSEDSETIFSAIDTNGDGTISRAELEAFDEKMKGQMESKAATTMTSTEDIQSETLATLLESLDDEGNTSTVFSSAILQYARNYQVDTQSLLDLLG
jgi:Ca2+-binding EF-hand superfamily protein